MGVTDGSGVAIVVDLAKGHLRAIEKLKKGVIYNLVFVLQILNTFKNSLPDFC